MNRDITPLLRSWLQEPDGLPEPRVRELMSHVHGTPQERASWLPPFSHLAPADPFSAARLVVAGIVVAVLGGLLLLTLVPSSPADVAPAQEMTSPVPSETPFSTDAFLSGMLTEDIEPGVLRIVGDGIGHSVGRRDGRAVRDLDILYVGPDDAIWVLTSANSLDHRASEFEPAVIWRLGTRGTYGAAEGFPPHVPPATGDPTVMATADDGTLWVAAGHLASFDGRTWTAHRRQEGWHSTGVEVANDGSVWATWRDDAGRSRTGRFDGSSWIVLDDAVDEPTQPGHVAPDGATYALAAGRLVRDNGDVWSEVVVPGLAETPFGPMALRTDADDTLWVHFPGGSGGDQLASFDGHGWQVHAAPVFARWTSGASWDLAPDGTVWARVSRGLASYDGGTWTEPVPGVDDFVIGRDGTVLTRGSAGVQLYDGEHWTRYPSLSGVNDIGLTSDGTGWAISDIEHSLYVVRPLAPATIDE
ncbi:MAG: hypothetical protein AB1Z67_01930 [Candidatus Limnocylindrales bacterium]